MAHKKPSCVLWWLGIGWVCVEKVEFWPFAKTSVWVHLSTGTVRRLYNSLGIISYKDDPTPYPVSVLAKNRQEHWRHVRFAILLLTLAGCGGGLWLWAMWWLLTAF